MSTGEKLQINVCSFDDLLGLPSVGKAIAYRIWELRKGGEITPESLASIPHIKMERIKHLIDFSTWQDHAESIDEGSEEQQLLEKHNTVLQELAVAESLLKKGAEIIDRTKGMTYEPKSESKDEQKMAMAAASQDEAEQTGARKKVTFYEQPQHTSTPIAQHTHQPQFKTEKVDMFDPYQVQLKPTYPLTAQGKTSISAQIPPVSDQGLLSFIVDPQHPNTVLSTDQLPKIEVQPNKSTTHQTVIQPSSTKNQPTTVQPLSEKSTMVKQTRPNFSTFQPAENQTKFQPINYEPANYQQTVTQPSVSQQQTFQPAVSQQKVEHPTNFQPTAFQPIAQPIHLQHTDFQQPGNTANFQPVENQPPNIQPTFQPPQHQTMGHRMYAMPARPPTHQVPPVTIQPTNFQPWYGPPGTYPTPQFNQGSQPVIVDQLPGQGNSFRNVSQRNNQDDAPLIDFEVTRREVQTEPHHQSSTASGRRPQPTMVKSFKFDGTDRCEDWSAFLVKFEIFSEASGWSDLEKRNQLCWCLTGTASRYVTNLIRHNKDIRYGELVAKMEQRFNHANETETLQVQFYSARQSPGEPTEAWADRLSCLADKAFRDVPENYVQSQIITKFLQALTDKAAGKAASMLKPKSIEEACQLVKLSQHLDSSIYGIQRQENNPYARRDPEPICQAMETTNEGEQPRSVENQMANMMDRMMAMQMATEKSLKDLHNQVKDLQRQRPPGPGPYRPFPNRGGDDDFVCYRCGGHGHIARRCPVPDKELQQGKPQDTENNPLNQQGLVKRR